MHLQWLSIEIIKLLNIIIKLNISVCRCAPSLDKPEMIVGTAERQHVFGEFYLVSAEFELNVL